MADGNRKPSFVSADAYIGSVDPDEIRRADARAFGHSKEDPEKVRQRDVVGRKLLIQHNQKKIDDIRAELQILRRDLGDPAWAHTLESHAQDLELEIQETRERLDALLQQRSLRDAFFKKESDAIRAVRAELVKLEMALSETQGKLAHARRPVTPEQGVYVRTLEEKLRHALADIEFFEKQLADLEKPAESFEEAA